MFKQSELIKMLSLDDIIKTKDDFLIHQQKIFIEIQDFFQLIIILVI